MNYAKMILKYRQKTLITQQELARILGVGVASISRWERGHYEPTMKVKRELNLLFRQSKLVEE
ncbi:MAG TPA: helix-turn-helix domain-containing protein [Bacilli bacterium]|nr:helix-turn-helix domain-containing protein [Bacilli bacterium]